MSAILTTKLAGNVGGGTFDYGFLDASGIGNGPFYAATAAVNASTQLINPATLESIEALQAAITAGITVSFAGQTIAVSALPLPPGASSSANQATANTLLGQIVSLLQQTAAETLWTDNTGAFFIRVDSPTGGAPTWKDVNGVASAAPGAGAKPAADRTAPVTDKTAYQAIAASGPTIAANDFIDHFVTTDSVTGAIVGQFWLNSTQGTILAAAPATSNLTALSLLPQGAATLAQQQAIAALLQQVVTALGATLVVKDAALETALGTTADAAVTSASTSGSAISWLRGIWTALNGTLKTASQANAPRVAATGQLAAANAVVTLAVDGMNAAVVQLTGAWVGTVAWFASVDGGTTYFPVNMLPFGGGASTSSASANGQWEFAAGGLTHLQAQMTAWTSGSATALLAAASGLKSIRVGNPSANPLTVSAADGGLVTLGSTSDVATASGANTSAIGALRAIRDKLFGSVAVTGIDGALATIGTTTDVATATTLIGLTKAVLAKLTSGIGVTGTFWQATQPISSIDGGLATIGATTDAPTATTLIGLTKAVLAKLTSGIAVTGTFWPATQPVSGSFWQGTQPVSTTDGALTTLGTTTDAASAAGAATTAIGALRAIRDKLLGSIAVTGTFWPATQPVSTVDGGLTTLGSTTDAAATSASTTGSAIAWLRGILVAITSTPAVAPARNTATDVSKTTVAATSTVLIPASAIRFGWTMQAPQSADVWINPAGGAAGVGLTGCFRVPAGTSAGSSKGAVETNAITYWCATAGLIIPATVL